MKLQTRWFPVILTVLVTLLPTGLVACTHNSPPSPSLMVIPVSTDQIFVSYPAFSPGRIMVPAGTGITWKNRDNVSYLITADDQTFAFNLLPSGSFKMSFEDTGIYDYHCREHPAMQGTVTVLSEASPVNFPPYNPAASNIATTTGSRVQPSVLNEVETKVKPSLVAIASRVDSYDSSGNQLEGTLYGTGWVMNENGIIATDDHVVNGAKTITVYLNDGRTYSALSILSDPVEDLALLDIGACDLSALTMADSADAGDPVIAFANIYGEGITANQGTISATGATFCVPSRETLYNTLETTAQINFGSSGGPLVDTDGNVVGIISGAIMTRSGQPVAGYAISCTTAAQAFRELLEKGFVSHAWIGVAAADAAEVSDMGYNVTANNGAFIIKVNTNSPADQSGLCAGDVIIGLNGSPISTTEDLTRSIRNLNVGQSAQITFLQGSLEITKSIATAQYPVQ